MPELNDNNLEAEAVLIRMLREASTAERFARTRSLSKEKAFKVAN